MSAWAAARPAPPYCAHAAAASKCAPPAARDVQYLGAPSAPMALAEGGEIVKTVVFLWERVEDDEDVAAPEAFDYAQ